MWADSLHNETEVEAFNHWNEDGPAEVPTSCAKCHSAAGLPIFLKEGVNVAEPLANGSIVLPATTTWLRSHASPWMRLNSRVELL